MYNQPFFIPRFSPYMMAQPMARGMMGAAPGLVRAGSLGLLVVLLKEQD